MFRLLKVHRQTEYKGVCVIRGVSGK